MIGIAGPEGGPDSGHECGDHYVVNGGDGWKIMGHDEMRCLDSCRFL